MPAGRPSPPSELVLDPTDVHRLLRGHAPHLAHLPLGERLEGWDNLSFRLGDDLAVRIPRRAVATPLAANEQRWLPQLARHLPLPVPAPVLVGPPTEAVPWSWAVVPWISGRPAHLHPLDGPQAAPALGTFLRALHRPAPDDAPRNPFRGVPLELVDERTRVDLEAMETDLRTLLEPIVDAGLAAAPHAAPPVWIHGDPHPANVIGDAEGRLAALVDWGDLAAGDPATDLAAAWMLLEPAHHDAFWSAYGPIGPDTWSRARAWATRFGMSLLRIGLGDADGPQVAYASVGRTTLRRVLSSVRPAG